MPYGIIGSTLKHSFSPVLHGMMGNPDYTPLEIAPGNLKAFFLSCPFDGFNVTMPYKRDVIPFLSRLSERARLSGSVNTVKKEKDGSFSGDNTDWAGFETLLSDPLPFKNKKALVLGSGGASQTVQACLKTHGIVPVVISRSGENNYSTLSRHRDAALIVNATPVGMYPDYTSSPVDLSLFDSLQRVVDLVYNPVNTRLVLNARARGVPAEGGLRMLCRQAVEAANNWGTLKNNFTDEQLTLNLLKKHVNIALIGMPGAGKSTVAAALGKLLSRPVHDTDKMIFDLTGRTPEDILLADGEKKLRALETKVLLPLCGQTGAIIATGGGAVTTEENLNLLKANSVVVYLRRPLEKLAVSGRPLTKQKGLYTLFAEREPLYESWKNLSQDNVSTPERAAETIWEDVCAYLSSTVPT